MASAFSRTASRISSNNRSKRFFSSSVCGAALLLAYSSGAFAQDAPIEQVVVSSTRLTQAGFDAPTPTTVVGSDYIAKNAESNLFTTINQLPSLQGSTGTTTGQGGTSGGTNGLSSLSLRGLGTIRTLTLLDGERVVPANVTGVADVSEFPQLLISRVDVVTGGASASYGSDAVAGVVNFVTDKKFNGFKANIQGGETTYGDDQNGTVQAAYGTGFLGDKAHAEVSGEYSYEAGIPAGNYGIQGSGPNGRTWFNQPAILQRSIAATPAGSPQYSLVHQAQDYQFSKYGLITAGPLQGIAFDQGGNPFAFLYGSGGTPSKTAAGTVNNCISPFCVGGDTTGNVGNGTSLVSALSRGDGYARLSYDIAPGMEIYGTANIASVRSQNQPNPGAFKNANLTIDCGNFAGGPNAYLPTAINQACAANGITTFQYGTANAELPQNIQVHTLRDQRRFVLGSDGAFNLLGKDWSYDAYFQHGENDTSIHVKNISLTTRYNQAIDAVNVGGTVQCRSAVAVAAGCQPLDIIGGVTPSAATMAYIEPINGPYQLSHERQEAFSASINGSPVDLWAGPLAVAFGVEYREEAYNVSGDPYGNGVTASTPNTAQYPADPLENATLGNNWYAGNFHNGQGNYHTQEGFVEVGVPLINSTTWGKADLDLAGRETGYSTSGDISTWKVGGTWATPVDGVKLRAVQSRDVRAPNLSELFAAPIVSNGTVINRLAAGQPSVTVLSAAIGNTGLKPEKSQTTELGVVFQPTWLPGFSASVDYFRVAVKGFITALSAQQIVDACQLQGTTSQCSNFLLTSAIANTNFVNVQSFNTGSVVTDGIDLEASYQADLADYGLGGNLALRGLMTHTSKYLSNSGLQGAQIFELAGDNTGNIPLWRALFTQDWGMDAFGVTLTERWFSDGVYRKEYVQCTTGCPLPTVFNPTIDNNHMDGAFYLDVGGRYNFTDALQGYFKIDNITNLTPAGAPTGAGSAPAPNSAGTNPALYDVIGRMYRIGVRINY